MTKPSWQDFGTHDESIAPELWDGVIGAWAPCLGPTGSRLHDMSRRANWGALTNMDNATDWVVSDGQYALDFDGVNDAVVTSLTRIPVNFTWSFWLKRASDAARIVIGKDVSGARDFNVWINFSESIQNIAGYLTFFANVDGQAWGTETASVPTNTWTHVAVGRRGLVGFVAVNGVMIREKALAVATEYILGEVNFARRAFVNDNQPYNGQLDDISVFSRPLSLNEIRQLYQLGRGGMYQRRRRSRIYLPQAGFQAAWARGSNVLLGFNQP